MARVGPKETAFVNTLNIEVVKPNLDWMVYDAQLKANLILQTQNFDILKRLTNNELSVSLETFIYTGTKRVIKLVMETKRVL